MTRDQAVARIQRMLGFRSDKVTEINEALQDAQTMLERGATIPWFLLTEVAFEETVAAEERVEVPSDLIREWEDDPLWYFNETAGVVDEDVWVPLPKSDLKVLRKAYPGEGAPKAYALDNRYYRIFPTPDAIYTLKHIYYKNDAALTSNVENQWLKYQPFLLIAIAGQEIAMSLRDKDAMAAFVSLEAREKDRMIKETVGRSANSHRYVMGDPD